MKAKDKVKALCDFEKFGIKKGDLGEIFVLDGKTQKAFVVFFDKHQKCKNATTLLFDEFELVEEFDDSSFWAEILNEKK